ANGTTEIAYSVKELEVAGYESEVGDPANGKVTVTNSQETTTFEVDKTWVNADGTDTWPSGVTVTVQLTADGKSVDGKTAELSAEQPSYTFESLPMYQADGTTPVEYNVEELEITGYESAIGELADGKITVTNSQETTTVTVTKEWDDNDDQDGKRTESVSVQLKAGDSNVGDPVTLNENVSWTYTWTNLPKYEGETEIEYSVEEADPPAGYEPSVDVEKNDDGTFTVTLTNTHEPEKIDINGKKTWDDKNNQDGKRPASITINLLADGKTVKTITVKESDGWKWSFTGLDKYADGKEIKYTITENPISGYVATVKGFDVTNTRTYDKLLPTGQLKWPIPVFGGLGLLLAGYGVLTLLKKRKDEET
ncbi:MAG: Cna B-type domain-containing protein, partial [Oscillospiraceae bacterium]|nr:Cna B-type domain-containing protein [Oscillospiraceae bacterium]